MDRKVMFSLRRQMLTEICKQEFESYKILQQWGSKP